MADDLNTAGALGALNMLCSEIFQTAQAQKKIPAELSGQLNGMLDVLGLKVPVEENWSDEIRALVEERQQARTSKNWAKSDQLRDALKTKGVVVEDTSAGPVIRKI
jgi:cysteinyl-tRNA synthetase